MVGKSDPPCPLLQLFNRQQTQWISQSMFPEQKR